MEKIRVIRRLKHVSLLFLSWFIIHQICIISDGLMDDSVPARIAVIFGNTVNEDGSLSPRLKARLDKGIELYRTKKVAKIFVSGGFGKEGHYEGSKMQEYLISKQIPRNSISVDNAGKNTMATALHFSQLFPREKSVVLVSQFHHISRAKLAFRKVGVPEAGGVHADFFEFRDIYACLREFFGYYNYLIS